MMAKKLSQYVKDIREGKINIPELSDERNTNTLV